LTVLLLGLAADAGSAQPFDWDVPRLIANARIGSGRIDVSGLPLEMHVVRSQWKANDLAIHYARRFIDAGFFIPPGQRPLPGSTLRRLTALDPQSMWSYTIVFYAEDDGTTTMVLGAADLGHRRPVEPARFPAPLFPGALRPSIFELEAAHALAFTTSGTEAEVISFYRQTLSAAGWREISLGTFAKNGRAMRVMAKPDGKQLGVVVLEESERVVEPRERQ
jgi:hypothetical protein